jgi:hypothetical protein
LPFRQQKCLAHFVRDIDEDLFRNPLDIELRRIAQDFGELLKSIVMTIDKYGLKRRHLQKHKKPVQRFLEAVAGVDVRSDLANKYKKRFGKSGTKMFTFLDYDGVPWNNNNAEHAIKFFAKFRQHADGRFTERSLCDVLVLASVLATCEMNNLNPLKFLLSKEAKIEALLRMAGRRQPSLAQPPTVYGTNAIADSVNSAQACCAGLPTSSVPPTSSTPPTCSTSDAARSQAAMLTPNEPTAAASPTRG